MRALLVVVLALVTSSSSWAARLASEDGQKAKLLSLDLEAVDVEPGTANEVGRRRPE